jgi:hypothetical protein
MALPKPDTAVHLKDSQEWDKQLLILAGFASLILVPAAIGGVVQGDWRAPGILVIPAAATAIGVWCRRAMPKDYAVLYPDRMELPGHNASERVVTWSEVTEIRWPAVCGDDASIKIVVPRREGQIWPGIQVRLKAFSRADRLTFIRYLRLTGAEVEQERWPAFCDKFAIPLVEACQREGEDDAEKREGKLSSWLVSAVNWLAKHHPFLAGVLGPFVAPVLFGQCVSRKMWWLLAAIFVVSLVINVRIAWACWASPITEAVLIVSAMMFLWGLFVPGRTKASNWRDTDVPGVPFWFAAALIGGPFVVNATVLGWIPQAFAPFCELAGMITLLMPLMIGVWMERRREKQNRPAREAEALRRWEVYQRTGQLPSSDLPS